jgi:hypothetical protein
MVDKQRRHQSTQDDEFVHQVAEFRGEIEAGGTSSDSTIASLPQ